MATAKKSATKPKPEPKDAAEVIHAAGLDGSRLIGDLADHLLAQAKAARLMDPWEKLKQDEQQAVCDQCVATATALVAGAIEAISTRGLPHVVAQLGKADFEVGGKVINLKAAVAMTPEAMERLNMGSNQCVLVFASAENFESAMNEKAQPDQHALIAEGLEHDEDGVIKDTAADARGGPGA